MVRLAMYKCVDFVLPKNIYRKALDQGTKSKSSLQLWIFLSFIQQNSCICLLFWPVVMPFFLCMHLQIALAKCQGKSIETELNKGHLSICLSRVLAYFKLLPSLKFTKSGLLSQHFLGAIFIPAFKLVSLPRSHFYPWIWPHGNLFVSQSFQPPFT